MSMSEEERKRAKNESVARWRARNPERARAQTNAAVKRFNENHKIEVNALRQEIKRLRARVKKLEARG